MITAVGQTETPTIESFEKAIVALANKTRVPIHYFYANDRHQEKVYKNMDII